MNVRNIRATSKQTARTQSARPVEVTVTFEANTDIARDILRRRSTYEQMLNEAGIDTTRVTVENIEVLRTDS